jgi:hypothetical protein
LLGAKSPFSTIAGGKRERCFACVITANLQRAAMHIHSVSAAACEILSASSSLGLLFCRREAEAAQINWMETLLYTLKAEFPFSLQVYKMMFLGRRMIESDKNKFRAWPFELVISEIRHQGKVYTPNTDSRSSNLCKLTIVFLVNNSHLCPI